MKIHMPCNPIASLLALFCLCCVHAALAAPDQTRETGIRVSLINLVATPERYDGKLVLVTGYVSIELENMSICPTKNTQSTKDCVWINIDSGPFDTDEDVLRFKVKEKIWKQFHAKTVTIRGTFDKDDTGHFGGWSGAIKNVIEVYGKHSYVRLPQ